MHDILLVEDEAILSEPFRIVLSSAGYGVDVAANGLEALELCKRHPYRLILLDLMMPHCNGVDFLKKYKYKNNTPVVLITNLADGSEVEEAINLGARKSLLKASLTPSNLLMHVKEEIAPIEA